MKHRQRVAMFTLCAVLACITVAIASGSPEASKQRIAIDVKSSFVNSKVSFVLTSMTDGALESDIGRGGGTGSATPYVVRNGQTVRTVSFSDSSVGKKGTFEIRAKVTSASAGNGYGADHGTWSFKGLTGVYAEYSGGGGLALVSMPNGQIRYRLEGFVRKS